MTVSEDNFRPGVQTIFPTISMRNDRNDDDNDKQ